MFPIVRRLRTFVSKTRMEYSSRGYLDKNAVSFFSNNVDQLGETQVYQIGMTPPSPPVPAQTRLPAYDEDPLASTVHQLSFDSHNDRLLEAWLLKQIQDKTTVPITLWSFNGPLGGDEDGDVRLHLHFLLRHNSQVCVAIFIFHKGRYFPTRATEKTLRTGNIFEAGEQIGCSFTLDLMKCGVLIVNMKPLIVLNKVDANLILNCGSFLCLGSTSSQRLMWFFPTLSQKRKLEFNFVTKGYFPTPRHFTHESEIINNMSNCSMFRTMLDLFILFSYRH